jgi:N-acetylglucosamine-6-phosphate deacetylase
MHSKILIKNCRLYNNTDYLTSLLIESGKIVSVGNNLLSGDAFEIEASGNTLCPGFIDVHIQGAGGSDILDGTPEAIQKISTTLARLGTTSFLGTTVVKPLENNRHLRTANQFVNKNLKGATLLGYHLEGPFINVNKKGGLDPNSIHESSPQALAEILKICEGNLKMMTIAPELPGNIELIKELKRNKVVAAFAHSEADYEKTREGFEAGIEHVTHLFNAMNPINHRQPGPITAIFENDYVTAQIISDGHHLHPAVIKMIYRNIGPGRCICITDGVQGMGLPEGRYIYNGKEYESKNGAARYLDGTLIGSTMSLGEIAIKFMQFTGCSLQESINSISLNPAKVLGIDNHKGKIEVGFDADLVLIDDNYKVVTTIVNSSIFPRA